MKNEVIDQVIAFARDQIGRAYSQSKRWNKNPPIFDCSSLIFRAFEHAGINITAGSTSNTIVNDSNFELLIPETKASLGKSFFDIATLKKKGYSPIKGDLLFFCTDATTNRKNKITHIAIVEDAQTIIHARGSAFGVRRDVIDLYGKRVVAISRLRDKAENAFVKEKVLVGKCNANLVNFRLSGSFDAEIIGEINKDDQILIIQTIGEEPKQGYIKAIAYQDGKAVLGYIYRQYVNLL